MHIYLSLFTLFQNLSSSNHGFIINLFRSKPWTVRLNSAATGIISLLSDHSSNILLRKRFSRNHRISCISQLMFVLQLMVTGNVEHLRNSQNVFSVFSTLALYLTLFNLNLFYSWLKNSKFFSPESHTVTSLYSGKFCDSYSSENIWRHY